MTLVIGVLHWKRRTLWSVRPFSSLLLQHFLISLIFSSLTVLGMSLRSVPDLENAISENVVGTPCVRLLNLRGEIGCSSPGRGIFQAPIQRFTEATFNLSRRTTVVLRTSVLNQFLYRTVNDPLLAAQVAGVLVEYGLDNEKNDTLLDIGFSPDTKFPQAEFAPYKENYAWNTPGSGVLQQRFNFPVFLMSKESTARVQEVAASNEIRELKHPLHVAEFDFVMQTTRSGTHNSKSCLEEWSCLPLGGYSVWSSLSPIDASASSDRPIILVVASMDAASLFRDMSMGADSSLSGMIAVLAAVDALSKIADIDQFQKQVVFLVLTGEAWGYLGSRRFLTELASGGPSVAGLNASRIHQILEVGSVGQALDAEKTTFYSHKQGSQVSPPTQEILDALQLSASSLSTGKDFHNVEVKLADKRNPGIPPSSLMSFWQKDRSIAGVVLEEFDGAFKNLFYHSYLDRADNMNTTAVACAASLIARSVYVLGNSAANLTSLDSIEVNSSLVQELVDCLLSLSPPGINCNLVKSLITPTQEFANHYVGVLLGSPSASPYLENVDDTSRFVWNFLASRTGRVRKQETNHNGELGKATSGSLDEQCTTTCSRAEEICVGSTGQQKGHCVLSTTRYVPAYSPRLQYEAGGWRLIAAQPGDILSEVDPVWTESFWKSINLRLYLEESSRYDELMLILGLGVTFGSFLAVVTTKAVFRKRLKLA